MSLVLELPGLPALQVNLAETLEPDSFRYVDEVPDLHRVAGEEWQRLEMASTAGVLAR